MTNQNTRSQEIQAHYWDNKEVPELRLIGAWMEHLGFNVGERVQITTRHRLLIIEPMEIEELKPEPELKQEHKDILCEVMHTLEKLVL